MKNTGIIYSSTERTPVVLPEMAELLPPLSEEQLGALEADLLKNGCYTSIIVNEDLVVIDGHNRKSLCDKHGLPYQMLVFAFDDLLEAKQWALDTQKGRRNLDKWELGKIALKLKPEIEARAKANQGILGSPRTSRNGCFDWPETGSPYWTNTTVQRKMQSSSASGQGCFRLSTHLQPAGAAGSALTPKEKNCAISMTTTQTCGNGCWSCRPCPTR